MQRIINALEAICNWGFCPDCGCNLANTPSCHWCELITEARTALSEGREDHEPECNCYCVGDQADASECPLHRR